MTTATLAKPAAASGKIDPQLIVPFVSSVREVFRTMVGTDARVARPEVKTHPETSYDVSSIVQFGGDVSGSVVISFELQAALKLVEAFSGMPVEADGEDFVDALGELGNMIAGAAKRHLACNASIGIPSVILGPGHHIARLKDVPCVVIPCATDVGSFAVEVSIKSTKAA